jgi:hypothetical protein
MREVSISSSRPILLPVKRSIMRLMPSVGASCTQRRFLRRVRGTSPSAWLEEDTKGRLLQCNGSAHLVVARIHRKQLDEERRRIIWYRDAVRECASTIYCSATFAVTGSERMQPGR